MAAGDLLSLMQILCGSITWRFKFSACVSESESHWARIQFFWGKDSNVYFQAAMTSVLLSVVTSCRRLPFAGRSSFWDHFQNNLHRDTSFLVISSIISMEESLIEFFAILLLKNEEEEEEKIFVHHSWVKIWLVSLYLLGNKLERRPGGSISFWHPLPVHRSV